MFEERRRNVAVRSVGCRTNQEEIAALCFALRNEGYQVVDQIENADIIIVNTCSVTAFTESKTRRFLNSISSIAPKAKILVTGCLAQQRPDELIGIGHVHWVVGNTKKHEIVSVLNQSEGGIFHSDFKNSTELEIVEPSLPYEDDHHTRFSVKIQEGCDYRCAYCIVPFLRGNSRSVKIEKVIQVVRGALDAGFKEIVLTGTHIGQFGKKCDTNLIHLLKEILNLGHDFRLRLSSLDPRDLNEELLELIGKENRICKHLHVSIQSLCASVLRRMDRPYGDLGRIVELLENFKNKNPHIGLGGDFIVGFPGETEEMFNETLENVRKINFSYGHVFRYSVRPQTKAALFNDHIPEATKTERSERLRGLLEKCRNNFLNLQHGISNRIIVESEKPVRGLTSNYIHVEVPGATVRRNSWLDVVLTGDVDGRYRIAKAANM